MIEVSFINRLTWCVGNLPGHSTASLPGPVVDSGVGGGGGGGIPDPFIHSMGCIVIQCCENKGV